MHSGSSWLPTRQRRRGSRSVFGLSILFWNSDRDFNRINNFQIAKPCLSTSAARVIFTIFRAPLLEANPGLVDIVTRDWVHCPLWPSWCRSSVNIRAFVRMRVAVYSTPTEALIASKIQRHFLKAFFVQWLWCRALVIVSHQNCAGQHTSIKLECDLEKTLMGAANLHQCPQVHTIHLSYRAGSCSRLHGLLAAPKQLRTSCLQYNNNVIIYRPPSEIRTSAYSAGKYTW